MQSAAETQGKLKERSEMLSLTASLNGLSARFYTSLLQLLLWTTPALV